jgi:Ca2+-transporting ATPase
MDLAASATFVSEPIERGAMKRPPVSPKENFLNRQLMKTLALGAFSLFIAVTVTYLFTWYTSHNMVYSQTVAFATWMFGHIFLAFNFRSDGESLLREGFFSNKVMLLWALVVFAALILGTTVLAIPLKITGLQLTDWGLVIIVAFVATFWMELKKIMQQYGFQQFLYRLLTKL